MRRKRPTSHSGQAVEDSLLHKAEPELLKLTGVEEMSVGLMKLDNLEPTIRLDAHQIQC
jgi:hypothetical protein